MKKIQFVTIFLFFSVLSSLSANGVSMRLGQGGFRHEQAPGNSIGGVQLAMDFKIPVYDLALSVSYETYKKDHKADSTYEIAGLVAVNVLYMKEIGEKWWTSDVWIGGGSGIMSVPKVNDSNELEKNILFDMVAGINTKIFKQVGFYFEGKYLYSRKTVNDIHVIDFNDFGGVAGISLNFNW